MSARIREFHDSRRAVGDIDDAQARHGHRVGFARRDAARIALRGPLLDQYPRKVVWTKLRDLIVPFIRHRAQVYASTIASWSFDIWQASQFGWSHVHNLQPDGIPGALLYDVVPVSGVSYAPFPRCDHCLREFHPRSMAFCPGEHPVCTGCLHESAAEQIAQGEAHITCKHLSGCRLPFADLELQGVQPEPLLAALEPHEDEEFLPHVPEDEEDDRVAEEEEVVSDNAEEDRQPDRFHDPAHDEQEERESRATQTIQEHINRCIGKIEESKLNAAPNYAPSVVYTQSKGKGRLPVDMTELEASSSESDYDLGDDTDTHSDDRRLSEALIQSRQRQRGFDLGSRGEGPSRPAQPPGSVSAPPSPAKAPQAAERENPVQVHATAPPMPTRAPQANQSATGYRFEKPKPILGPVYAELHAAVVSARKAREKVQQRRGVAETKLRASALGWTQGRLDSIDEEWNVAQQAVVAAERALDQHRRGL